jgi:hypothetical protein
MRYRMGSTHQELSPPDKDVSGGSFFFKPMP